MQRDGEGELAEGKVRAAFVFRTDRERTRARVFELEDILNGSTDLHLTVIVAAGAALKPLGRRKSDKPNRHKESQCHPGEEFHGTSLFQVVMDPRKMTRANTKPLVH